MKRPSRRAVLIASASVTAAAVLIAGTIVTLTLKADADAQVAYDTASAANATATSDFVSARRSWQLALSQAVSKATYATELTAVDSTLLADPATVDALQAAVTALVDTAGLVDTDGVLAAPGSAAAVTVHRSEPTTREGRIARAAVLVSEADALLPRTAAFTAEAGEVADAISGVDAAAIALANSAHSFGAAAVPPARASADTVAAFAAAVAAIEAPTRFTGDLTELVFAYQEAWYATLASDAAARSGSGAAAATYIKGVLIVNKTYGLPSTFGSGLTAETSAAFTAMQADAAALGLNLYISSGFRSFATQTSVYNRYKANEGQDGADRHSARPGHSEHQSGLAFDLNTITESFGSTAEGVWVAENAHLYGFIVRYPQGKEAITGYVWEPWHLRYVGTDLATELHSSGQTLEEYLGVTSVYS